MREKNWIGRKICSTNSTKAINEIAKEKQIIVNNEIHH